MAQLPQELIVEILLPLPVKSVLRFRCLSKSLCALIDSPHFINSRLCKSSQNFNLRKLIFLHRLEKKFDVCDVNLDLEEDILRLEKPISLSNIPISFYALQKQVYGYCRGLLLLSPSSFGHGIFELVLWNPTTRKYRDLPVCPFEVPAESDVVFYSTVGSGLGYDDSTDDYKAFFILLVKRIPEFETQVWIYGLKSNNWRRVQNFPSLEYKIVRDFPRIGYFSIDGTLHWLCTLHGYKREIVAFDVRKETFSIVPQPGCSINSLEAYEFSSELHVLEGCLCISYFFCPMPSRADLYIRKKDGVGQFSWTKLYSVREPLLFNIFCFENVKVLGYSKRGDKILLDIGMPYMVSYDLKEKSFGEVKIDKDPNWNAPILCLESLVSVGGGV